jgi:hypothetical protein
VRLFVLASPSSSGSSRSSAGVVLEVVGACVVVCVCVAAGDECVCGVRVRVF